MNTGAARMMHVSLMASLVVQPDICDCELNRDRLLLTTRELRATEWRTTQNLTMYISHEIFYSIILVHSVCFDLAQRPSVRMAIYVLMEFEWNTVPGSTQSFTKKGHYPISETDKAVHYNRTQTWTRTHTAHQRLKKDVTIGEILKIFWATITLSPQSSFDGTRWYKNCV